MAVQRDDPYGGYNFLVDLGDGAEAGFQEISGLAHEIAMIEYREGSDKRNAPRKIPGLHKVSDVTLKRGLAGSLDLYRWMLDTRNGADTRRTVTVRLMSEDRSQAVVSWKLLRAFPVRLAHGPLRAADSTLVLEELVIASEAIEIE